MTETYDLIIRGGHVVNHAGNALADIGVRLAPTDRELKLGVLTALIGAPFFLFLVLKTRREMQ